VRQLDEEFDEMPSPSSRFDEQSFFNPSEDHSLLVTISKNLNPDNFLF
jgi:hypothetical protein